MSNEWEERARATKAFKIARVLYFVRIAPERWRDADDRVRMRVAKLAGVSTKKQPSDKTWQAAVDILLEMIRDDY